MISLRSTFQPNPLCQTFQREFLGLMGPNVSINSWDTPLHNHIRCFLPQLISQLFLSNLFDEWFPNRIHLYTWSAQQIIVPQHVCHFFKTFYHSVFFLINYLSLIPLGQIVSLFFTHMAIYTWLLYPSPTYCISVGGMFYLCILYCNCMRLSTYNSWLQVQFQQLV